MSEAREWIFLLREIIDAAARIEKKVSGHDYDSFLLDEDAQDIVERRLQILAEAAGRIPEEIQKKYAQVPWKKIRGMRNILAHEHYSVVKQTDRKILWETATSGVPELVRQIQEILHEFDVSSGAGEKQ